MSDRVKIRAEVQRLRRELGEQRDVNLDELIAYIDSMPENLADGVNVDVLRQCAEMLRICGVIIADDDINYVIKKYKLK